MQNSIKEGAVTSKTFKEKMDGHKKKVLITGATGFIGKYIVEQALENDYEVFLALRKQSHIPSIDGLSFRKISMNFSSQSSIASSLPSNIVFDTVVHNAGVKACSNKEDFYKYNTELTQNLCHALREKKALRGKFIYMSSLAALGAGDEKSLGDLTEIKEEKPISHYGRSKLWAEKEVLKSGLDHIILRPTAVYGKGTSDYKYLIKLIKKGLAVYTAKPHQKLSFVHAADVAKSVFMVDRIANENQVFNVSDGVEYTLQSVHQTIADALGVKIKFKVRVPFFMVKGMVLFNHYLKIENALDSVDKAREVTALNWKCSAQKLKDEIGFKASHLLKEIID